MPTKESSNPLIVRPHRQVLIGIALLVIGAVAAFAAIKGGLTVASGPGFVIAVWGLALIGNSVVAKRRGTPD